MKCNDNGQLLLYDKSTSFTLSRAITRKSFPLALNLRNPHSVMSAIKHRPHDVVEVRIQSARPSPAWNKVADMAAGHRIPVVRQRGDHGGRRKQNVGPKQGRPGVGEAIVKENKGVEFSELFTSVSNKEGEFGLWLALDQLQDPHNVGAIFRTAAFFGVRGVIVTQDRSAPLNATVYDVASGGVDVIPFSTQTNLSRAITQAKKADIWVVGTSEHADQDVASLPVDRNWMLVMGNEEKGLRRLTQDQCDHLCSIKARGSIGSLNVSVAAGVFMAHLTGSA